MFTINPDQLQNAILQEIMKHPGIKVKELQHQLEASHKMQYTQQNLYRIIAKMIDAKMIIKTKGKLSLHLHWLADLKSFAQQTLMKIADSVHTSVDLPTKDGQKKQFVSDSLKSITPVWDSVIISLIEQLPSTDFYEYVSHLYWTLCMSNLPDKFHTYNTERSTKYFTVVGNNTVLDRHGSMLCGRHSYREVVISKSTGLRGQGYKLQVLGDYIVELYLPERISNHFEFMFEAITNLDRFDSDIFYDIFTLKADCSFSVTKDSARAAELRSKIIAAVALSS